MDDSLTFAFLDDLRLEITASARVLRHYRAEYGRAASSADGEPDLRITFARKAINGGETFAGGHKTLRWRVRIEDPSAESLRVAIALTGEPRAFGLSLLQGYAIEPLLALLAPRTRHVLLPAAAIGSDTGARLLIGRSRSGKSSLSARAAAAGRPVLGDDHVLVASDGTCRAFPRRLRVYSDLSQTAPAAHRRLTAWQRGKLSAFGGLRRATRGFAAPPLRVALESFGSVPSRLALPLGAVIVLERADVGELERQPLDPAALVDAAIAVIREQRRTLERIPNAAWQARLASTSAVEAELLHAAFASATSTARLVVPKSWPAGRAVTAVEAALAEL